MYKAMGFADYVVSHALRVSSDCLQCVADAADQLAEGDVRRLRCNVGQLRSLWQVMRGGIDRDRFRSALARLDAAGSLLPDDRSWLDTASVELMERAGPKSAHVPKTARVVEASCVVLREQEIATHWDLNGLGIAFQEESECWRDRNMVRGIADRDLIERGIGWAYGRARRACRALVADPVAPKYLRRARRRVGHCVDHLELLRPGLSDGNVARVWLLCNLARSLDRQIAVQHFLAETRRLMDEGELRLKAKDLSRLKVLVKQRRKRLVRRSAKLVKEGFGDARSPFVASVAADVASLALGEITVLPAAEGAGL